MIEEALKIIAQYHSKEIIMNVWLQYSWKKNRSGEFDAVAIHEDEVW